MLHYPALKIKTAYKTCLNLVSYSFVSLKLVKTKTRTLAIYHSSGPWKAALKSFRQAARENKPEKEKPTTPGNRPTFHSKALCRLGTQLPHYLSKGYHTQVTKSLGTADLPDCTTPLAACTRPRAPGRSLL